jgi:hypothetical protein
MLYQLLWFIGSVVLWLSINRPEQLSGSDQNVIPQSIRSISISLFLQFFKWADQCPTKTDNRTVPGIVLQSPDSINSFFRNKVLSKLRVFL